MALTHKAEVRFLSPQPFGITRPSNPRCELLLGNGANSVDGITQQQLTILFLDGLTGKADGC